MKPMESCAGVGLYENLDSGIESNACAMLRCSPIVRPLNAVVIGFAGGPAGVCWAARATGSASVRIAAWNVFMMVLPGKGASVGCANLSETFVSRNGGLSRGD